MGFKQLLTKVEQAEAALESRERRVADDWRQFKQTWKEAWTPSRIVIAGVVSGFLVGRTQPLRTAARSGQFMQLATMLSGLFAGGSAQVAAGEAEQAAQSAENVADAVTTHPASAPAVAPSRPAPTHDVPTPPEP